MKRQDGTYDAIVVGARAAGAPTAMLLARQGYRVLLVDRAHFPSDTLSTHQVQVPGGARLKRWGLLDRVIEAGAPPAHEASFFAAGYRIRGAFPSLDGVAAVYSPRRTVLDKILVDGAVAAGAELREGFVVDELLLSDGCVTGVRGHTHEGTAITERSRVVVGADGHHSRVASAVQAAVYRDRPALTCAYYTYFEGIPLAGGEMYNLDRRTIGVWPTNDGLAMICVFLPAAEFHAFRADIAGNFDATIARLPELHARVHAGRRVERFYGTGDLPNFCRKPYGPGWALVGDAGCVKDPITGSGISDAFRDAELLAKALGDTLAGGVAPEIALAGYEDARNAAGLPLYEFTLDVAAMRPLAAEQVALFEALSGNPAAAGRLLGVLTGLVSPTEFFAPDNLFRIMGLGRMVRLMAGRLRASLRRADGQPSPA